MHKQLTPTAHNRFSASVADVRAPSRRAAPTPTTVPRPAAVPSHATDATGSDASPSGRAASLTKMPISELSRPHPKAMQTLNRSTTKVGAAHACDLHAPTHAWQPHVPCRRVLQGSWARACRAAASPSSGMTRRSTLPWPRPWPRSWGGLRPQPAPFCPAWPRAQQGQQGAQQQLSPRAMLSVGAHSTLKGWAAGRPICVCPLAMGSVASSVRACPHTRPPLRWCAGIGGGQFGAHVFLCAGLPPYPLSLVGMQLKPRHPCLRACGRSGAWSWPRWPAARRRCIPHTVTCTAQSSSELVSAWLVAVLFEQGSLQPSTSLSAKCQIALAQGHPSP